MDISSVKRLNHETWKIVDDNIHFYKNIKTLKERKAILTNELRVFYESLNESIAHKTIKHNSTVSILPHMKKRLSAIFEELLNVISKNSLTSKSIIFFVHDMHENQISLRRHAHHFGLSIGFHNTLLHQERFMKTLYNNYLDQCEELKSLKKNIDRKVKLHILMGQIGNYLGISRREHGLLNINHNSVVHMSEREHIRLKNYIKHIRIDFRELERDLRTLNTPNFTDALDQKVRNTINQWMHRFFGHVILVHCLILTSVFFFPMSKEKHYFHLLSHISNELSSELKTLSKNKKVDLNPQIHSKIESSIHALNHMKLRKL